MDHHLHKLLEAELIAKDSDNNYTATSLGEQVLQSLTDLSAKISKIRKLENVPRETDSKTGQ
jgi:predicted transcriptional regulator